MSLYARVENNIITDGPLILPTIVQGITNPKPDMLAVMGWFPVQSEVFDEATQYLGDPVWDEATQTITRFPVEKSAQTIADELDANQSFNIVTRYQLKMALKELGFLDLVKAEFATLAADADIIIMWENSQSFPRNGVFAEELKTTFNRSDAAIDTLWATANTK